MTDCAIEFPGMVEKYYHSWFRFHPFEAVDMGLQDFQDRLPPIGDDDQGALAALFLKVRCCMEENGPTQLTKEQVVDFQLLRNSVQLEHLRLLRDDWRQVNPIRYLPNHSIQQLLMKGHVESDALIHRLQEVPSYLKDAELQLSLQPEKIPELWLQQAIEQSHQGFDMLSELMGMSTSSAGLKGAADQARVALDDFSGFLEKIESQAAGSFAIGADFFALSLKLKHFVHTKQTPLNDFIQTLKTQITTELAAISNNPADDYTALSKQEDIPLYDALVTKSHQFYQVVNQTKLVNLPEESKLIIEAMPAYLAPISGDFLYQALKEDQQQGVLWVKTHSLSHHSAMMTHICTQQLWPGTHCFSVTTQQNAHKSIPRLLGTSSTLVQGWLLYIQQVLAEQGIADETNSRFLRLHDQLKQTTLAAIDLGIHTQDMPLEQAREALNQLGLSANESNRLLSEITQYPGEKSGAILGWQIMNRLLALEKSKLADNFTYQAFHQKLLSMGPIALPIIIQELWGEVTWETIQQGLFST